MMVAGINKKKPEVFTSDVTGNYFSYYANAIGENDDKIKEKLRERYVHNLNIKKGAKIALDIFQEINTTRRRAHEITSVVIDPIAGGYTES